MREIKFRVWDGEILHTVGELYFCRGGTQWLGPGVGSGWCWVNPDFNKWQGDKPTKIDILMQYTGLKDKNGREIWEGSTVKFGDYIGVCRIGHYVDEQSGYCRNHIGYGVYFDFGKNYPKILTAEYCSQIEVIGNIHENPELLKD